MATQSSYLVNIAGNTATLSVIGQGGYISCGELLEFLNGLMARPGKTDLVVDFSQCTSLDSTILGLFARTALDFAGKTPAGRLILINLEGRNLEVVKNLGLQHIAEIAETKILANTDNHKPLETSMCDTGDMITAHEALISAYPANEPKFHDVVETLRAQS